MKAWAAGSIVASAALFAAFAAGHLRSATYGFSAVVAAAELCFCFVLIWSVGAVVHLCLGRMKRSLMLCVLLVPLLCATLSEAWCHLEEASFRSEVRALDTLHHSGARWFPYGSSGLMYTDGSYAAHD